MNTTLTKLALDVLSDLPAEFRKGSPEDYQQLLGALKDSLPKDNHHFRVSEIVDYEIPSIDPGVVKLCKALDEPIRVLVRWDADRWGRGEHWLRVEADIYGRSEEDFAENEEALKTWLFLQETEADLEMRYDGDYNWASLHHESEKADELAQQYVAHQKSLYPDCDIVLD